jgi:hypothetical protein
MNGSSKASMRGKRPGVLPGKRPDNVDHAITGLIVELHWRATQLHGGIALEFDATTRFLFNLVHPGFVHQTARRWTTGDMKVWNLRVTDCCANPLRAGAPRATAAEVLSKGTTLNHGGSPCWEVTSKLTYCAARCLRGFPANTAVPGSLSNGCDPHRQGAKAVHAAHQRVARHHRCHTFRRAGVDQVARLQRPRPPTGARWFRRCSRSAWPHCCAGDPGH